MKICLPCERMPLEAFHATPGSASDASESCPWKPFTRRPMAEDRSARWKKVEGAICSDVNDVPAGDLPVAQFAAPFWLLGYRSTTQVSNNPDFHDRFYRDSCRKG